MNVFVAAPALAALIVSLIYCRCSTRYTTKVMFDYVDDMVEMLKKVIWNTRISEKKSQEKEDGEMAEEKENLPMEKVDKLIEDLAEDISKSLQDRDNMLFDVVNSTKALAALIAARASMN